MAELIITYPAKDYQLLKDGKINISEFLTRILNSSIQKDKDPTALIGKQLLTEYSDDGAFVEISGLEIGVAEYDPETLSGKIRFNFAVHYLYTCSAITKDYERVEKVNFSISKRNDKLTLSFFETPQRTTAGEF